MNVVRSRCYLIVKFLDGKYAHPISYGIFRALSFIRPDDFDFWTLNGTSSYVCYVQLVYKI